MTIVGTRTACVTRSIFAASFSMMVAGCGGTAELVPLQAVPKIEAEATLLAIPSDASVAINQFRTSNTPDCFFGFRGAFISAQLLLNGSMPGAQVISLPAGKYEVDGSLQGKPREPYSPPEFVHYVLRLHQGDRKVLNSALFHWKGAGGGIAEDDFALLQAHGFTEIKELPSNAHPHGPTGCFAF